MTYNYLADTLHSTANAAAEFFRKQWGVKSFEIEQPISDDISYRPTLSATTGDAYVLCIEVSLSVYPGGLDQLIVDCLNHGMPAKVFVAVPKDSGDPQYRENLRRASASGVGLVEVGERTCQIIHNALSLSLTGCRRIQKEHYPPKYRRPLSDAERTFREGDPAKGCGIIYGEIEAVCRRIAEKTYKRGCWTKSLQGGASLKLRFDKDAWLTIVQTTMRHLDAQGCGCGSLTDALLGRVLGVVPYRNEVEHKPKTRKQLIKRDAQLRTRFESAADLLLELVTASASLRV